MFRSISSGSHLGIGSTPYGSHFRVALTTPLNVTNVPDNLSSSLSPGDVLVVLVAYPMVSLASWRAMSASRGSRNPISHLLSDKFSQVCIC